MKVGKILKSVLAFFLSAAVSFTGITSASAEQLTSLQEATSGSAAIAAVQAIAPTSLLGREGNISDYLLSRQHHKDSAGLSEVPLNLTEALSISGTSTQIDLYLPFARDAVPRVLDVGLTEFDNQNGSTTLPIPKADGSVQVVTVIASADAPEHYTYDLDLPEGASLVVQEDSSILIAGSSGQYLGGVAPPWARDSAGIELETHYEINGSSISQVISHKAGGVTYPVVADPWLGVDLYHSPYVTFVSAGYKVNVTPTGWGIANAQSFTWWAHRDEVRTKLGEAAWRWTPSVEEQFYCHLAGLPLSLPEFNLESWRPNMSWSTQAPYSCNYPEGGWGSIG
ncbi:MAG: DUF2599 domain-containing protein [Rhodoglobus sp.]